MTKSSDFRSNPAIFMPMWVGARRSKKVFVLASNAKNIMHLHTCRWRPCFWRRHQDLLAMIVRSERACVGDGVASRFVCEAVPAAPLPRSPLSLPRLCRRPCPSISRVRRSGDSLARRPARQLHPCDVLHLPPLRLPTLKLLTLSPPSLQV